MRLVEAFLALDRWTVGRGEDGRARGGWLAILPVLIPLLIATAAAAAMGSAAMWFGALFGVVIAASLIASARDRV